MAVEINNPGRYAGDAASVFVGALGRYECRLNGRRDWRWRALYRALFDVDYFLIEGLENVAYRSIGVKLLGLFDEISAGRSQRSTLRKPTDLLRIIWHVHERDRAVHEQGEICS